MHGYEYCSGTFVTLCNSETYKETTKGKFHHITVQYPVLVRYHLQRILVRYRTDEHSLGTRIRTVTRASEITRVPIYGPIRVA